MRIAPIGAGNIYTPNSNFAPKNIKPNTNTTDVFQKTSIKDINFTGIEKQSSVWCDEKITKIYNDTYSKFVLQNPIINKLNITKPELVFEDENEDYLVGYRFVMNHISISPYMKDSFSLIALLDENDKIKEPVGVVPDATLEKYDKYFKENKKLAAIKLNDEEKEAYASSAFAHELRHWLQTHLVASTEGSSYDYLFKTKLGAKGMKEDFSLIRDYMNELHEDTRRISEDIEMLDYAIKYEPKELLDKNTKLKLSLHPKDTRYFSVNKHFAKSIMAEHVKGAGEGYKAQPHEADAFNYQFEFFNEEIEEETKKGARRDVLNAISYMLFKDAKVGMEKMSEYGYNPLIFE